MNVLVLCGLVSDSLLFCALKLVYSFGHWYSMDPKRNRCERDLRGEDSRNTLLGFRV